MTAIAKGIEVTSHVSRDLLQSSAYFNTFGKVVWEYVSNSLDAAKDNEPVLVDVEITDRVLRIKDNGRGMSRSELLTFFRCMVRIYSGAEENVFGGDLGLVNRRPLDWPVLLQLVLFKAEFKTKCVLHVGASSRLPMVSLYQLKTLRLMSLPWTPMERPLLWSDLSKENVRELKKSYSM